MERVFVATVAALLFVGCAGVEDASQPPTGATEAVVAAQTLSEEVTTTPTVASPITTTGPVSLNPAEVTNRSITVGGMGSEYSEPVRCIIDLGSTSRRPTVGEATSAATASARAMTDALAAAGVAPSDIQSTEFSVGSFYEDYPIIGGYETHIGYRVTLPDVEAVGQILASAVAAGGDDVRAWGVRFEADPTDLIGPAREKAWADVKTRAADLAALADEPLGDVLDIHEKVLMTTSQGMMQGGEGDSASFDIPISPGVSGVVVLLTVTYAIGYE